MVGRKHHLAAEGASHRHGMGGGKGGDIRMGLRIPARATGNDDGVLRGGQLGHDGRHIGIGRVGGRRLVATGIGHGHSIAQHVFWQRNHHRAGAAAGGHRKGAGNGLGNARRIINLGRPLHHAAKHRPVVQLLEGLTPTGRTLNLADKQDHRGRILHGNVQAGRGIGGTRAARDHADPWLACELALGFGHHGGTTLLAANRRFDGRVIQRIEHRQKALAGHGKNLLHAVDQQLVYHQLATGTCWLVICHVLSPLYLSSMRQKWGIGPHLAWLRIAPAQQTAAQRRKNLQHHMHKGLACSDRRPALGGCWWGCRQERRAPVWVGGRAGHRHISGLRWQHTPGGAAAAPVGGTARLGSGRQAHGTQLRVPGHHTSKRTPCASGSAPL